MLSKTLALAIAIVLFVELLRDKRPRYLVSLCAGCWMLVLLLLTHPPAVLEALSLHSFLTPRFWFAHGGVTELNVGINWSTMFFLTGMMVLVEGMGEAGFFDWVSLRLARAHGQPRKEADQRVDDIARGTDGGQRLLAHKLADHHAVHRVVQLLENLADQHGNGEADQMAGDGALRHIDALFLGRHSKSFHKKAEIAIIIPHIALLAKGAAKKFQIRKMKKAPR